MASIHRRTKSKNWYCAFYYPDGRRALRSTGTSDKKKAWAICLKMAETAEAGRQGRLTDAQARAIVADCYAIANRDKLPSSTMGAFLASWLKRKELEVAEKSFRDYGAVVRGLCAELSNRVEQSLDAVTVQDAARFRDAVAKRTTPATGNKYLKIARCAWNDAMRDGLAGQNPFAKAKVLKVTGARRRAFSMQEIKRLLAVASGEWRGLILFGLYTGQRLGDIAGLSWNQIDTAEKEIHFLTRKTGRNLSIPIAEPLMQYIQSMPAMDDLGGPLFPNAHRVMRTSQSGTLSVQFADLLAHAGLADARDHQATGKGRNAARTLGMSFHCLRHTATSLLKNAGVSDVVAREIIGHDSEDVSRVYTHIERDTLRAAVAKLPVIV